MKIHLFDHFTYKKLLRFVLPSIIMMIFTSIYGVVDGLFVSNCVGKIPFAALNLIMPFPMLLGALGFMIGTGGSAIVSTTLGEGDGERAKEYFSMLVYITVICGVVLTVLGLIFLRPIAILLGADEVMLPYCMEYGRILILGLAPFMLQNIFQCFFVTAEKPNLGLLATVMAGLVNIGLDYIFVAVLRWGLTGAAAATVISQFVGAGYPVIYFARKNKSLLKLTKFRLHKRELLKTCTNGSSELMTNVSLSLVNMIYNFRLIQIAGDDGVAAYGVIMYVNFIFISIFLGYSIGSAPIISYNYGAQNHKELKNLFKKSLVIMGSLGVILTGLAIASARPLSKIFVGYDENLLEMTCHGFTLYSFAFLFMGFNIFGSSFFTALNNGAVSAVLSFLRTLFFQVVVVIVLPIFLKLDGIWLSIVGAEFLAILLTVFFFVNKRKRYQYA